MKRSHGKLAAQPESAKHRPKTSQPAAMSTAERVRASLLIAPPKG